MPPPRLHLIKPLATVSRWTVRLLLLQALTQLFTLSMIVALTLEAESSERFSGMTAFQEINAFTCIQGLAWLAVMIQFLVWQYRLRMNYELLGIQGLAQSPGMGVAWWFIPVANLFMPYIVLQELWRAGLAAQTAADGRVAWRKTAACPIIKTYWIVKITNIVVPLILQFAFALTIVIPQRGSPSDTMAGLAKMMFVVTVVNSIGHVAECFLEIFIVERLTKRYDTLEAQRQPLAQHPHQEEPPHA